MAAMEVWRLPLEPTLHILTEKLLTLHCVFTFE
jgi:hypothetical protein